MKKWNKKLGTSKKEQGIVTPEAPQNTAGFKAKRKEKSDISNIRKMLKRREKSKRRCSKIRLKRVKWYIND